MNVYRAEVKLCGSAYIKANSQEEATKMLYEAFGRNEKRWEGVDVLLASSERDFEDPRLPDVSLSPAMTAMGPWTPVHGDDLPDMECVAEDVPESEDD